VNSKKTSRNRIFGFLQNNQLISNSIFCYFVCISLAYSQDCKNRNVILNSLGNCNDQYNLVFEDNFSGNSLDLNKWEIKEGVPRDFDFELQKAWHTPNNISVSNGSLKITSLEHNPPISGTFINDWNTNNTITVNFDYSTGEIWSKEAFGYGMYEARCKVENGKGLWPAFWIFGDPFMNEIDFFEIYGNQMYEINTNIYTDFDQDTEQVGCHDDHWTANLTEWHTYRVYYEKDKITWEFDDNEKRKTFKFTLDNSGNDVSCETGIHPGLYNELEAFPNGTTLMHIIFNQAIRTGNNAPNIFTNFPAIFEIDYVKYYRKKEDPICACNYENIIYQQISNLPYDTYAIDLIQTEENVKVLSTQTVNFHSNIIELNPGLTVENGASFSAYPSSCYNSTFVHEGIQVISNSLINNQYLFPCVNPLFTVNVKNAQYFKLKIIKPYLYQVDYIEGMVTSNLLTILNSLYYLPGNYIVELELFNCYESIKTKFNIIIETIDCIEVNVEAKNSKSSNEVTNTDILENQIPSNSSIFDKIYIYPNPANDVLYIKADNEVTSSQSIKIYDKFGKCVFENNFMQINNIESIDISSLLPGMYSIHFFSNGSTYIKKIMVI
jgi:beta-glucanase (GH16 family)